MQYYYILNKNLYDYSTKKMPVNVFTGIFHNATVFPYPVIFCNCLYKGALSV